MACSLPSGSRYREWRPRMNEHEVAETAAAHMVLAGPAAEVWRRVAHGELTPDAGAACVLEGHETLREDQRAELERAKQVFAPPTAERREALLAALLARQRGPEDEGVVSLAERARTKGAGASTSKGWLVGLLVAAAAVLVLWMMPSKPQPEQPEQHAFVAGYDIELAGMPVEMRGGPEPEPRPDELPRFDVDGKIEIGLVPNDDVEGPIAVVGFARERSGTVRRLEFEPLVHPSGKLDITAPVRALGLQEGQWELVFAVGRRGGMPASWEAITAGGTGYEVVRTRVEIVPMRERGP